MTAINTITPVNLEETKYGDDELDQRSYSPAPNSSVGSVGSSFEKVSSVPSEGVKSVPSVGVGASEAYPEDEDDYAPPPPEHLVAPVRRSHTPPVIFTSSDGSRGFEVRPRSTHISGNHSSHRLSSVSPFKPNSRSDARMSSEPPFGRSSNASPEVDPAHQRRSQYGLVAPTEKYVGDAVAPRAETIELYRKSAAKSHDPDVEFELAQYMVQTALLPDDQTQAQDRSQSQSLNPTPQTSPGKAQESPHKKDKHNLSAEEQTKRKLFKEALEILRKLADKSHAPSQYLLGDILSTNASGHKKNPKASFHYFMSAAKHGHAEAAYRAALCLQQGWGTAPDAHRALKMYKSAASRGQPGALFRLGMAYFYGHLGISDNATNRLIGLKWLTRAVNSATEIYNHGPYELARIYELGYKDVVPADPAYAVKLYVRSAELNFVPAALKLGKAYEYGEIDCPQDAVLSIHYYTIAALGGDPQAQYAMCAWYMVGAGPRFPRNEDEAYEWALRAAHGGHPKAQLALGMFYEKGIGCHRDIFQSTMWYRRAANNGDEVALKRLRERNQADEDSKDEKSCAIM